MKKFYYILLFCFIVSCFFTTSIPYAGAPVSKEMVKKCPTCSKTYPEQTKFCGDDGTELVEISVKLVCPECKKEGTSGEKFCREHGKELVPPGGTSLTTKTDVETQKVELAKKYYKEGSDYCDAESYDLAME